MKTPPTPVIFVWHMHQPYYKVPGRDYYLLPWVRLHGVKDYYGMAYLLDKFNKVKVTFNFSGVLLNQIIDYVQNDTKDYYEILSEKRPSDLSSRECSFITSRFFSVNFERYIRPHRRYAQLYQKHALSKKKLSDRDIQDLQVLFNLCWFHPLTVKHDKHLREIIGKGRYFTADDKAYVLALQRKILKKIIPLYKKLLGEGRIEVSITPYAHPILPLISDTDVVRNFSYLRVPAVRFSHPEDCRWHIRKAQDVFKRIFSREVRGSWPSEGAVSEEVVRLYRKEHLHWIATDEEILFKSLTSDFISYDLIKKQRDIIYRPYKFDGVNIFFRDRNLSDAISFIYQSWDDPLFAARDFLEHCRKIHYYTRDISGKRCITIVMDGENAWEYYKNNGMDFLTTIYKEMEKAKFVSSSTPSEFLKRVRAKPLKRLACGSWINGDLGVWIGSDENNHSWEILKKTRDAIVNFGGPEEDKKKMWEYFYMAEGSDWNWWNTFEDKMEDFKKIFLSYIIEIFKLLGKSPKSGIIK